MRMRLESIVLLLICSVASASESWTLERVLDYALDNNPDARIALQRVAAAQAGLEQANSAFRPRFQIQSSYSRTDNPMMVFGSILNQRSYRSSLDFNDVPGIDNLNTRGIVTVPLYTSGRNVAGRAVAEANTEAARYQSFAVRNALSFEVVRSYHTVLKTRQFVFAAEAAVKSFEGSLAIAKKRFDVSSLLKSDVLDVEVRLSEANEDLIRARNANSLAKRVLLNLLGSEEEEIAVSTAVSDVRVPDTIDFAQRPELAAARERERAAQARVRAMQSGYRPKVSAFAGVDHDYSWDTKGDGTSYSAGILAQWEVWNGFSTRAQVREAKANLETVREELRKLRLGIKFEVEQARLSLSAAVKRLEVSRKTVEQATESAELTHRRFEQGLSLSTQLINSETALVAARVRRAEAESDYCISVAALRKALALPQLDSNLTEK